MSRLGVEVVAFDVNETLFSLDRLRPAFAEVGLDPAAVPLWFARTLRDGFCLTVVGGFATFTDIATEQLYALAPSSMDADGVMLVLSEFERLDPQPDAAQALALVRESGARSVTLTNGGVAWITQLLEQAGLSSYVEHNLSVDALRRWKPAPEVYRYAAETAGVRPDQVALVSAHPLDCDGARRAGLRSGRVNRTQVRQPGHFQAADVEGPDLVSVVRGLLA